MNDPVGVVLAREGGSYRILLDGVERVAVLRGKAKREVRRAVAGDRIVIDSATLDQETIGIVAVEERSSLLERRVPDGRGTRPVAANVDQVLVVTATVNPEPIPQLIDRLLVVAESNDIPAAVIINKIDLAPAEALTRHLAATNYPIYPASAATGEGIEQLRAALVGKVSVLTGPSGAGKSSLLNAVEPGLGLRVGALSAKVHRGRHTTVTATMIPLAEGGFVVDTPGFSEVGLWAIVHEELDQCFPEFRSAVGSCRFGNCLHKTEPGCAVRALVEVGEVVAERYASYRAILAELEGLPEEWE
ncbi:MAG: ribosome small subunit-dependent GTPase A [Gemmatimonadales bacterium]|nr:ribosome small subunit-dependent GTPase A [Gemmatimonadales bacterium]MDZ4391013.1 ribosome small subunit-dependent GTPase A [Gemmatimonadales bacterium]